MNTPLSQCHASLGDTQCSAACQTHMYMVHVELDVERGMMEDGREQGEGGNKGTRGREGDREGAR